ncbi:MAG: BMP family ABC transporter substrate-binding protein [Treponema sp.]|nr:BMP family ABC transporter substrate-binding protein [Treponema sp.]
MKSHFIRVEGLLIFCAVIIVLVFPSCKKETVWEPGKPLSKEKIKIGVIFLGGLDDNSHYDYAHNTGILEMQRSAGIPDSRIIRKTNVFDDKPAVTEGIIRDCIAEGANIIIATSWEHMDACEKLAAEFPNVIFAHSTGYKYNNRNFTNYSVRLYQVHYLSGIAAGMKTKTGKTGYVAAMDNDNNEVTRGINAFAIGVETVNPKASVYVKVTHSWYDPMGETDAANALIAYGCDVIAQHCDTPAPQIAAQKAGVWGIGSNSDISADAPDAVITSVIPNWGMMYTKLLESVINGTFTTAPHFYGLAEEAVSITPINEQLAAPGTAAAVDAQRRRIIQDGYNVFDGIIETNTGKIIGEEGKTLSDTAILGSIDWYYRNVVVMK